MSSKPELAGQTVVVVGGSSGIGLESAYHLLSDMDFSRDVLTHVTRRLQAVRDRTSGWVDLGNPARVLATLNQNGIEVDWVTEQDGSISNPSERIVVGP